jgi:hypothetical protein
MKNFLILLTFSLPFFSLAQDSCQLKKTTDAFTHQTKISTGFVSFASGAMQLSISIDATSTDIDFFLWFTSDQKCFDDQSTIQVNFEGDRLKSNQRNTGSMNCEGAFHFTFRNTPVTNSQLQRFVNKKINSFHIVGTGKTVTDVNFSPEQKEVLMRMINCVVNESKTLLKK